MLEHHAYLFRFKELEQTKISLVVKFFDLEEVEQIIVDNFGISESRSLIETAFKKPRIGEKKLVVVYLKNITVEAAQALLKILEEPPRTTVFAFCVPESLYLLPTLLSRFNQDQSFQFVVSENQDGVFKEFKAMQVGSRMTEVTNRLAAKDMDWVNDIKSGLINFLSNRDLVKNSEDIEILLWIAKHLQTRGASNKQLLEELALTL